MVTDLHIFISSKCGTVVVSISAVRVALRAVLLHTLGEPHYVGKFATFWSRCSEMNATSDIYF